MGLLDEKSEVASPQVVAVLTLSLVAVILAFLAHGYPRSALRAPKGFPLIGNAFDIPRLSPWITFLEWRTLYGDLIHLKLFGKSMLVLNSQELADDLMVKRWKIYSDRPRLIMAGELVGYDSTFALQAFGERWRQQRKLMAQEFSQSLIPRYFPFQEQQARLLVYRLLRTTEAWMEEVNFTIGSIIIKTTYGYSVKSKSDRMYATARASINDFGEASLPGNFLVDFLPVLKRLPEWLPGTDFLRKGRAWRERFHNACWEPYLWLKDHLGTDAVSVPNLCGSVLDKSGDEYLGEKEPELVWSAASALGGGIDSSASTIATFALMMVLHPEIQERAQKELDSVVGHERLPGVVDREKLPYIRSLVTEVLRYHPPLPLGIPHALSNDDVYENALFKKGTLVIPNIWGMLHNPDIYPNPMEFNPDRYNSSDDEMKKVTDLIFGFGRRICPGSHFALGSIYAIVLTFLSTCVISPGVDEDGNEALPKPVFTSATISRPELFKIKIKQRVPNVSLLESQVTSSDM